MFRLSKTRKLINKVIFFLNSERVEQDRAGRRGADAPINALRSTTSRASPRQISTIIVLQNWNFSRFLGLRLEIFDTDADHFVLVEIGDVGRDFLLDPRDHVFLFLVVKRIFDGNLVIELFGDRFH